MATLQSWLANTQALGTATALSGTEQFRLIQGGVSKTVTAALLASYLASVGSELTIGTTPISSGTSGNILYNAAGFVGELGTTGSGNVVRATSPTLVTPALGTPSALVLTNATGLPATALVADTTTAVGFGSIELGHASDTTLTRVSAGVVAVEGATLLTATAAAAAYQPLDADLTSWAGVTRASGFDAFVATPSSANLRALLTDETGTDIAYFVGGALGTPASGTLTSCTGLPVSTGISGLGTGVATWLATPSSANLLAAMTDETGTGSLVFGTSPTLASATLTSPSISTPTLTGAVTLTGGTVNGTLLSMTQTWGSTGTYTGLFYNVTDSGPSNSASLLLDLQVGTASAFRVRKDGAVTTSSQFNTNASAALGSASVNASFGNGASGVYIASDFTLAWSSSNSGSNLFSGTKDLILARDAANTLALRNSTNAQTFNVYNTYTDASNYELGRSAWVTNVWTIGTTSAGTGGPRNMRIGPAGAATTYFCGGGSDVVSVSSLGFLFPTDNTYDIGASGVTRPRSIYAGTQFVGATGTQSAPSYTFTGNTTTGLYSWSNSPAFTVSGTITYFFSSTYLNTTAGLAFGSATSTGDTILTRAAAATLQHGAADAASPVAQTISFQSVVAGTSNTAGVNTTFKGSAGTGTGAGGNFIFQIAPAGSSGTAQNAFSTILTLSASTGWVTAASGLFAGFMASNIVQDAAGPAYFCGNSNGMAVASGKRFAFSSTTGADGTADVILARDAANTLALRNSTSAQTFNVYNTYTDGSNYERLAIRWNTNVASLEVQNAGTGSARNFGLLSGAILYLGSSGSYKWNIDTSGHFQPGATNTYDIGASANVVRNMYTTTILSTSVYVTNIHNINNNDAIFTLASSSPSVTFNNGGTGIFRFHGSTSSFPAFKRSATDIQIRLADDSGYAGLQLGTASSSLKVGTHSAIGAETVTGYITIKDSAGTDRKIAVVS